MARPRLISDEQILATMRAAVFEHGPAVSLDRVADELGVTTPALLKRFGNRQALMLKALKLPDMADLVATFEQPPDARPLQDQLVTLFDAVWAFFAEAIPCVSALRESGLRHDQLLDPKKHGPMRAIKGLTRWLEAAREGGLVESDALESVATAMLGALQTRVFTAHVLKQTYSARSQRQYIDDIALLFTRALAPAGKRRSREDAA